MIRDSRLFDAAKPIFARFDAVGFEHLSAADRIFVAVWLLDYEVCNGGFSQFFRNSSGEHAGFATFALHAIGAEQTQVLLERAIDVLGGLPSPKQADREEQIHHLSEFSQELFERLDSEFYREPEDLNHLLLAFISRPPLVA